MASRGLALAPGQMSWYQRKRDELGAFILREYPSTLGECFQSPVEGAIYAELIDKLRGRGAIKPWKACMRNRPTFCGSLTCQKAGTSKVSCSSGPMPSCRQLAGMLRSLNCLHYPVGGVFFSRRWRSLA